MISFLPLCQTDLLPYSNIKALELVNLPSEVRSALPLHSISSMKIIAYGSQGKLTIYTKTVNEEHHCAKSVQ